MPFPVLRPLGCIFLFLLFSFILHSQENTEQGDTVSLKAPSDASVVRLRQPDMQRLDELRSDRDYNYERDAPPPENPFARFWYWLIRKLSTFFQSSAYENFWQYVILAGIGGLIVWLLYKAEFLGGWLNRKAQSDPLAYHRLTENIHELDFNTLIEEAIEQHNYRLAIRWYYLKTLKQLTDKQLIHWQLTKTNRIYVEELINASLKNEFERLTSQFEYVWYGEFSITASDFNLLKEEFQHFSGKI